ncbi:hypothetical protein H7849_15410 [Alloacidobacterium dinghuense]|uniref:Uncharacterized protein n=1 Tax=Alloacidobacterium dinghuense TaxID=2763107 RepID=A0A7G8BDA9_9BACT|nr:hypothetical protein [Alloacidobacterium dinghuense]QNI30529.1 hypothetical protein H7849_15410 [Alloacidobacterium dinghuense]
MSDISELPTAPSDHTPSSEPIPLHITNLNAAKELFKEFDDHRRFHLQTSLQLYDKLSSQIGIGTNLYEKLILLDGATIALSVTFLGSLSSRLGAAHLSGHPHLWMVAFSWLLLILSIYFSYRVILDRHSSVYSVLARVSADCSAHNHQRAHVSISGLSGLLKGEILIGEDKIDVSKLFAGLAELVKQEGEDSAKRATEYAAEIRKASREGVWAKLALNCTMLAVIMLCLFTVLSLRLLF